ncbi:tRNA pseudouridine(38-40) synthase TruA [uncultured Tyzzerella sp.]|uniref:tRNA pseudouridine(38-40) synthase TruA n=1 Tax=uncultured Tyzzerella sp. TaxID=2321398 RepID=UPI0029429EDA|nr:tRNA pseudouridine(38-40) synthase TruA [uncultured Tyzzerella sp.]
MKNKNILLTVSYDGTNYFGWQKQDNVKTIQGEIEKALSNLFKENISIRGASRTDTGVHALCQLVLLKYKTNIPIDRLPLAINSFLNNKEIVVTNATYVDESFHPQNSVYKKTYQYKIYNAPFLNPLVKHYTEFVHRPLDIEKMKLATKYFLGEHDFKAFCATGSMSKTTVRTIYDLTINKQDGIITIEITGNGFLYNMVRIIVGTLIDVGHNRKQPEDIKDIIASKDRQKAGKTASACGLTLYKIYFDI